jgi:predicted RNA-binding protein with PUA-like domain
MTGLIGVSRLTGRPLSSLFRRRLATSTRLLSAQQTPNYFLLKSEPSEFSIQDLEECGEEEWDGVRNYQARNKLRAMKVGDLAYFYHSSCSVPGIVGTMRIVREVAPDETALDPNHNGYDPKSTPAICRWDAVRLRFETKFHEPVTLRQLKKGPKRI